MLPNSLNCNDHGFTHSMCVYEAYTIYYMLSMCVCVYWSMAHFEAEYIQNSGTPKASSNKVDVDFVTILLGWLFQVMEFDETT